MLTKIEESGTVSNYEREGYDLEKPEMLYFCLLFLFQQKCVKYWPNIEENERYGEIIIEFQSQRIFADFISRKFKITNQGESRYVEQLQFTSWPDHGVPLYPKSLVPLMRRIAGIPYEYPVIIHCRYASSNFLAFHISY